MGRAGRCSSAGYAAKRSEGIRRAVMTASEAAVITGRAISRPPKLRPHSDGAAAQWGERSAAGGVASGVGFIAQRLRLGATRPSPPPNCAMIARPVKRDARCARISLNYVVYGKFSVYSPTTNFCKIALCGGLYGIYAV